MITELTIEQKHGSKGRAFSASLLAYASCPTLMPGGADNTTRPIWMVFASSEGAAAPFIANLRTGKKAIAGRHGGYSRGAQVYECLRTGGYVFASQRFPEGIVTTAYLHSLFVLDPGMVDPQAGISFAILLPGNPPAEEDGRYEDKKTKRDLAMVRALAPTFAAFVDRRSRAPLIPQLRFYELLLEACLENGLASFGSDSYFYSHRWGRKTNLETRGLQTVGIGCSLMMSATHDDFESVLSKTVTDYFKAGSTR